MPLILLHQLKPALFLKCKHKKSVEGSQQYIKSACRFREWLENLVFYVKCSCQLWLNCAHPHSTMIHVDSHMLLLCAQI